MKKIKTSVIVTAIISLTIIQLAAMYYGINGTLRTVIVGIVAALAGFAFPSKKILK